MTKTHTTEKPSATADKSSRNFEAIAVTHDIYDAIGPRLGISLSEFRHIAAPLIEKRFAAAPGLLAACGKAADTFAELKLGLRLLGKSEVAKVCEIAEEATRAAIASVEGRAQ